MDVIEVDPYFIQGINEDGKAIINHDSEGVKLISYANKSTQKRLSSEKINRSSKIDKKSEFLKRTFEAQYKDTMEKLSKYRTTNEGNKNSALINQMKARLIEIEEKQEFRMNEIDRERTIQMRPPKCLLRVELNPDDTFYKRIIVKEYKEMVYNYEAKMGRSNFDTQKQFGLVDFYSENSDGTPRYIILIDELGFKLNPSHKNDLLIIKDNLHFYYINEYKEIVEVDIRLYI